MPSPTRTPAAPVHAPHAPLRSYYGQDQQRCAWVVDLFDRTALHYERIVGLTAMGSGSWYRRRALSSAGLQSGMQVIDVGTGTGLVAREAARLVGPRGCVLGIDPSAAMLANARAVAGVRLALGRAESIPAPDGSADFLCLGYALRHISDLSVAFREFERVLRPGGRLCLLEITRPEGRWRRALLRTYMRTLVPWAARMLTRERDTPLLMRYYWDTIENCVAPQAILAALEAAGFIEVTRRVELGIFSQYCARRPQQGAGDGPGGAPI
ncbi:MAG TPA: class I SAM-dependent methyltransferase [Steroidobacteraceae bacterium]|nr:class I SAM-dependent methyltransferase [Steroidobacteraceae bacterium]